MNQLDLSQLQWTLSGFTPHQWQFPDENVARVAEIPATPARVPGSVQGALRDAGIIPDWNVGLDARHCEWVENRHWMYETLLPDEWIQPGQTYRLRCLGLDYSAWVFLNGVEVGKGTGTFVPHVFDLTDALRPTANRLRVIFDCPPRWLGQHGFTSRFTQWKPRFNYTWDWTARLVQIGIWDDITLESSAGPAISEARCVTVGADGLRVSAQGGRMRLTLADGASVLREEEFEGEIHCRNLPVKLWQPNRSGAQPLYDVTLRLLDGDDEHHWRVGFKTVEWRPCEGAPPGADPWICVVNGRPLFLQGVNWTPIRPNFADVTEADYRKLLMVYRDMGCNVLRVWGGAFLEKQIFYDLCDEFGLLVWQEFPLSSSGAENWPPEDAESIKELTVIARSYIHRRQHHASLLLWSGGNELQGGLDGSKTGVGKPVDVRHPLIRQFAEIVRTEDPDRRFVATSASGPRFTAEAKDFGKGLHWDVHGPWRAETETYWANDDALFRSEVGAPGASPVSIIQETAGQLQTLPASVANPLWARTSWWIEWPEFITEFGREPREVAEFVAWSQRRQAEALVRAVSACKRRFPRCGGILLWMGHDSFPCTANTAILDFHGNPKPSALAVAEVFLSQHGVK